MFWGELDKDEACGKSLTIYMYMLLIFGFIGVFVNCCTVFVNCCIAKIIMNSN